MAGYDLHIQGEDQTDMSEGMSEAYNTCIPAPVTKGGNTVLRNDLEDDTIARSYEETMIRPHTGGARYSQLVCDDSHLQGEYRSTMGGY